MLNIDQLLLVLVDMQGKSISRAFQRDRLLDRTRRLVRGAQALGVPMLRTELDSDHLGHTVGELMLLAPSGACVKKMAFSAYAEPVFRKALEAVGRTQVLLVGQETHVAIYQTARDLWRNDIHVEVVADAVTARSQQNHELGLGLLRAAGISLTSVETALCELVGGVDHPAYPQIRNIVS